MLLVNRQNATYIHYKKEGSSPLFFILSCTHWQNLYHTHALVIFTHAFMIQKLCITFVAFLFSFFSVSVLAQTTGDAVKKNADATNTNTAA